MTRKVGQTGLVLVYGEGSLVRLSMQDFKSLCTEIMIFTTLVVPKFDFYILIHANLKVGQIRGVSVCGAYMSDAPTMQIC